jgi:hypothetical protein
MEVHHAHVSIELDVGAAPIQGSLRVGREAARRFEGWIELASLIEAAATSGQPSRAALSKLS